MRRRMFLPAVVAAALTIVLVGARAVQAGPAPTQLLTFRDHHDSALMLTIEANPQASQAGMFSMRVPGRGLYVGRTGAALRVGSPQSTTVQYSGPADLIVATATSVSQTSVSVTLQAQLDPAHHTGEATLTVGKDRFHLVQPAVGKGETNAILADFQTAFAANDWRALYALTTSDISSAMSADAFVAAADAQRPTAGVTTAMQRLSVGDVQTNPAGMSFFIATYAITSQRSDGTSFTGSYDAYFVLQGEGWKLWFTTHH